MSEPRISLLGFVLIGLAAGYLQLASVGRARWPRRVSGFAAAIRGAQAASGTGKVVMLVVWWWFGWHFIAR